MAGFNWPSNFYGVVFRGIFKFAVFFGCSFVYRLERQRLGERDRSDNTISLPRTAKHEGVAVINVWRTLHFPTIMEHFKMMRSNLSKIPCSAKSCRLPLMLFGLLTIIPAYAKAGLLTVVNTDTANIAIPVFDTSLGTLNSVELQVTLRSGLTNPGGGHSHSSYTVLSSNIKSNPNVSSGGVNLTTSTSGSVSYSVVTPVYSGGGLSVGSFNFGFSGPSHSHSVSVSTQGLQQVGPSEFRAVAGVSIGSSSSFSGSYSAQTTNLLYTGGDIIPFLGPTDITIGAGPVNTNTVSSHSHNLSAFAITVSSDVGPWVWNFSSTTVPSGGSHFLTLVPRFDTVTTFHFTPIPEPSSVLLLAFGCASLLAGAFNRRRLRYDLPVPVPVMDRCK